MLKISEFILTIRCRPVSVLAHQPLLVKPSSHMSTCSRPQCSIYDPTPGTAPWKTAPDGPSTWVLALTKEILMEFWPPGFDPALQVAAIWGVN